VLSRDRRKCVLTILSDVLTPGIHEEGFLPFESAEMVGQCVPVQRRTGSPRKPARLTQPFFPGSALGVLAQDVKPNRLIGTEVMAPIGFRD